MTTNDLPKTVSEMRSLNDSRLGDLWDLCQNNIEANGDDREVWERRLALVNDEIEQREDEQRSNVADLYEHEWASY